MWSDDFALEGLHVTHAFGTGNTRTDVLRDVSLGVYQGEFILIMGPSGSGKSTLLALMSGLMLPQEGEVWALGQDLGRMTERQRKAFRQHHCGFIFQGYNLFPALNARQQLEMVLNWGSGVSGREAQQRATEMLELLGLRSRTELRPDQLSGGEKQRVAVGRALVKEPQFCFADEPTSALDWEHGKQVIELLREATADHNTTVFVVSHDARIMSYADRVFHLDNGQLVSANQLNLP